MNKEKIVEKFKEFIEDREELLGDSEYTEIYLEKNDIELLKQVLKILED